MFDRSSRTNSVCLILLDATECLGFSCTGVQQARDNLVHAGHYDIVLALAEENRTDRGVTVMQVADALLRNASTPRPD